MIEIQNIAKYKEKNVHNNLNNIICVYITKIKII